MKKDIVLKIIVAALLPVINVLPAVQAQVHFVESVVYPDDPAMFHGQGNVDARQLPACGQVSSNDGRYVVFESNASNIVIDDNNHQPDIFLRDTVANTTQRINVDSNGNELFWGGRDACISGDGRYVLYISNSNSTDETGHVGADVFLYDRQTNSTRMVSKPRVPCSPCSGGAKSPSISADGSTIVFQASSPYLTAEANTGIRVYSYTVADGTVTLISKAMDGTGVKGYDPSVSADGRYIAFVSAAANLVNGDTNDDPDVFVHDRLTNTLRRVSVDASGHEVPGRSNNPRLAGSGSHVAFVAVDALVAADNNGLPDVYVYRLSDGQLELASQSTNGDLTDEANYDYDPSISFDGRKVTFMSKDGKLAGVAGSIANSVFVRDLTAGTTTRIAPDLSLPGRAEKAIIAADGASVLYTSTASAVPEDNNGSRDVFRTQLLNLGTALISKPHPAVYVASGANNGTAYSKSRQRVISADGRYVVFVSRASNLDPQQTPIPFHDSFHVYLADRKTGQSTRLDIPYTAAPLSAAQFNSFYPSISADGRYVAYMSDSKVLVPNDTNDRADIFLWDRLTQQNRRLTVNAFGTEANGTSTRPVISADGQYVVFESAASNLTTDLLSSNTNIFLADVNTQALQLISKDSLGFAANRSSNWPSVSANGRYVAFASLANNLVANDSNNSKDIFLHDRLTAQTTRISVATSGTQGDDDSDRPTISDDGSTILFESEANTLGDDPNDNTAACDLFVHTPVTGITEVIT